MFVAYLHKGELIAIYVAYCVQMDTSTFMAGDCLAPAMRRLNCLSQIYDVSKLHVPFSDATVSLTRGWRLMDN
jgi:hypothetical protein